MLLVIGSIIYLTACIRPDIPFTVCKLSRDTNNLPLIASKQLLEFCDISRKLSVMDYIILLVQPY